MSVQTTHIPQMEAQLRSLSFDQEPPAASAETGFDEYHSPRRWPWALAFTFVLAGATAGAYYTEPGRAALEPLLQKIVALQAPVSPSDTEGADAATAFQAPQLAASPAAAPAGSPPVTPLALPVQQRQIIGSGYSRAERDVILGAPLPGRIAQVTVAEGDVIAAGAALVNMENRAAREAVRAANTALQHSRLAEDTARLRLAQATQTQDRVQKLVAKGVAKATQVTEGAHAQASAEIALKQAQLAVAAAQEALISAQADLDDHRLAAPFGGVVAALRASPGMMTAGEQHDALLRLFDPASIVVDVDIAERSLADISIGQTAQIVFDAWPGQSFDGSVAAIAPILSKERGTLRVAIALAEIPPALRPNMAARVTLLIPEQSEQDRTQDKGDNDV